MNEDDMYALIQFIQEKEDDARSKELQCLELDIREGALRYEGMKDAYHIVLSKIFAQRCSQRPHIDWVY